MSTGQYAINLKDWKITQRICNIEEPNNNLCKEAKEAGPLAEEILRRTRILLEQQERSKLQGRIDIEKYVEECCIDRRTLRPPYRLRVDQREIIDCLKRNFILAAQYYETSEFNLMQGSKSGMELGKVMKRELGYSANSYWWDIIHWRLHLYLIAKREIRECMFKTTPIQQALNFLDAQEKENLTRGTTKGSNMDAQMRRPGEAINAGYQEEKPMSIKRHKQITDLAYELKAAMDKKMPDLKGNELCMLGEIMQRIGQLK